MGIQPDANVNASDVMWCGWVQFCVGTIKEDYLGVISQTTAVGAA